MYHAALPRNELRHISATYWRPRLSKLLKQYLITTPFDGAHLWICMNRAATVGSGSVLGQRQGNLGAVY
jgi:hypothetical protein